MRALQKARRREHLGNAAMTDTPDDLVKRLRDVGEIKDDDAYEGVDPRVVRAMRGVAEVMKQGADRIEALESRERMLLEALEPLVDVLELDFGASDDDSESLDGGSMRATFGDLRRARRALAGDAG